MTNSKLCCKNCNQKITCTINANHQVDEYQHEDGSWYYSCGSCIQEGGALGSIVHWCQDMFGMISGKPRLIDEQFKQAVLEAFNK